MSKCLKCGQYKQNMNIIYPDSEISHSPKNVQYLCTECDEKILEKQLKDAELESQCK